MSGTSGILSQIDNVCFCVCRSIPKPVPQESNYFNSQAPEQLHPDYENGEASQMTWAKVGRGGWWCLWTEPDSAVSPPPLQISDSSALMAVIGSRYSVK